MATWVSWKKRAVIGSTLAITKDWNTIQISLCKKKNGNVFLISWEIQRVRQPLCPDISRIPMRSTGFFPFISWFCVLPSGFIFRQTLPSSCQHGCWQFQAQNVLAAPEEGRGRAFFESSEKSGGVLWLGWYISQHRLLLTLGAQQPSLGLAHITCPMSAIGLQAPRMVDTVPFCSCTIWNLQFPLLLQYDYRLRPRPRETTLISSSFLGLDLTPWSCLTIRCLGMWERLRMFEACHCPFLTWRGSYAYLEVEVWPKIKYFHGWA